MNEKTSILIVDDRADNRLILASLVREYFPGVAIFEADNATDGIRIATEQNVDAALIDVQMPGMDGIEMCRRLKADEMLSQKHLILLTSHKTSPELRAKGLAAGADDFIHRPFDNAEFIARLKVMFRIKRAEDQLRDANEHLEERVLEGRDKLIESEERYRSMLEFLPQPVFECDTNGLLSYVNLTGLKKFGYSPQDLEKGLTIAQLIDEQDRDRAIGNLSQTLNGTYAGPFEYSVLRKDGSSLQVLTYTDPIIKNGQAVGIRGVGFDISERKRAENIRSAQLRLIEYAQRHTINELLQKLLDEAEALTGSEIGFYHFVDDDQVNLSLQSWSTNTQENMCTENIADRHYPINQAGVWVDCVRQRRAVIHNDYASLPHKKGLPEGHAPVIRELVVPVFRNEKIVAIIGVGNKKEDYGQEDERTLQLLADLAWETVVQKQAADALRLSNNQFRNLIEKMSSGFALHELVFAENGTVKDYRFLDVNDAFEGMTGLKRTEIVGKTVRQALPKTEDFWIERFSEVALTGIPQHFNNHSSELGKDYNITAYCPAPKQFVTIINDISDQKAAEKEIIRLNAELEDRVKQRTAELELSNQELEAFSYSVSHDLRAPLRAINGQAGMLEEELSGMSTPTGLKHLKAIRKSSRMMGQLVDDLILYARLSKSVRNSGAVNLDDIVQSCWKESAPEREDRNIKFQVSKLPPCQGDRSMLTQLIANLLSNAIKYTGCREQAVIEIGSKAENGKTVYFVRDNGIGFDMRYIDKLFHVFQRLHREEDYEGTGIGLSLAKRIVERHGGQIWAEGDVDKGATFSFTLER